MDKLIQTLNFTPNQNPVGNYLISQDPGTNSLGQAALDLNTNKIKMVSQKPMLVATVFDEGKSRADARSHRHEQRAKDRKKNRLKTTDLILLPALKREKSNILNALENSYLTKSDRKAQNQYDHNVFYKYGYKTFNHALYAITHSDHKMPIDLILVVLHHLNTHRGHFNDPRDLKHFQVNHLNLTNLFNQINQYYQQLTDVKNVINLAHLNQIVQTSYDPKLTYQDAKKQLVPLISNDKSFANNFVQAIFGKPFQANLITGHQVADRIEAKNYQIDFTSETIDEELLQLANQFNPNENQIIQQIKDLYNYLSLKRVLQDYESITEANLARYDQHHEQLKVFKQLKRQLRNLNTNQSKKDLATLDGYYAAWVDHGERNVKAVPKKTTAKKKDDKQNPTPTDQKKSDDQDVKFKVIDQRLNYVDFTKKFNALLKKYTKKFNIAEQLLNWSNLGTLFLKQTGPQNMQIPHQLYELEMLKLIENQKAYYPELGTYNKFKSNEYKLISIFNSKVPYFVGPLVTREEQLAQGIEHPYAWLKRRRPGKIDIFNLEQTVDLIATAKAFIYKIVEHDQKYLGEYRITQNSLDYQLYTVLDELNKLKLNHKSLPNYLKLAILNDLFKHQLSVTPKQVKKYLVEVQNLDPNKVKLTGFSNPARFNNSLTTYLQLKPILGTKLDQPKYHDQIETIIEDIAIYPNREMIKTEISQFNWLSQNQIDQLSQLKYNGWGKMSKVLLSELKDQNDHTLLDAMLNSTITFQSWFHQDFVEKQVDRHNQAVLAQSPNQIKDYLHTLNPKAKKAVEVGIRGIQEYVTANHNQPPKYITIESARGGSGEHQISLSQNNRLKQLYQQLPKSMVHLDDELEYATKNNKKLTLKQYLYFIQNGVDLYSGQPIASNDLNNYQIDHIIPQAVQKNDSLDNFVLTHAKLNHQKADHFASDIFNNQQSLWKKYNEVGLITNRKYKNLTLDETNMDKYQKQGFIASQFTSTNQIVQALKLVLQTLYPNTKFIDINGRMTNQLRQAYHYFKNRNLNDNHHAHDAYFQAIISAYLLSNYPQLHALYLHDEFAYNQDLKNMTSFNFLAGLDPQFKNPKPIQKQYQTLLKTDGNQIYHSKNIKVTKLLKHSSGEFYNQNASKKGSFANLSPLKPGLDVKQYGGYANQKTAYNYIIRIAKPVSKNSDQIVYEYRIVGVYRKDDEYLKRLSKIEKDAFLIQNFIDQQAHQKTPTIYQTQQLKIIIDYLPNQSLINDHGVIYRLSSANYQQPGVQLLVDDKANLALNAAAFKQVIHDQSLTVDQIDAIFEHAYQNIVENATKYSPAATSPTNFKRLKDGLAAFMNRPKFETKFYNDKAKFLKNAYELINSKVDLDQFSDATQSILDNTIAKTKNKDLAKSFNTAYDELIKQLKKHSDAKTDLINDHPQIREYGNDKTAFTKAPDFKTIVKRDRVTLLNEIVSAFHCNGKIVKIKELGITSSFGNVQKKFMKVNAGAIVISQSPFGMHQKIRKVE